jgi:hypothetical protein
MPKLGECPICVTGRHGESQNTRPNSVPKGDKDEPKRAAYVVLNAFKGNLCDLRRLRGESKEAVPEVPGMRDCAAGRIQEFEILVGNVEFSQVLIIRISCQVRHNGAGSSDELTVQLGPDFAA